MAHRVALKTTYEVKRVIDPIYSGGPVSLSKDGRVLATALGEDVILSGLENGRRLARIEGDGEAVTSLILTPQVSHLIVCSRSMSMRIYSLEDCSIEHIKPRLTRTLKPHPSPVVSISVDSSGSLLTTGAADGIVKVWDIAGGFTTHTLHGHSGVISALKFFEANFEAGLQRSDSKKRKREAADAKTDGVEDTDNGQRLASASEDGQIKIWNLHKRKAIATLASHVSVVRSLDFDPSRNILMSASRDKTVIVWDASTWKIRNTIPVLESVEDAGFLKDGLLFFIGGENGRLRVWSSNSGREITTEQSIEGEEKSIVQILRCSGLPFVISVHADQTLLIHSLLPLEQTNDPLSLEPLPIDRHISGTHDDVIDVAYVGRDKSLLAVATNLEDLRLLSLYDETKLPEHNHDGPAAGYFGADVGLLKGHEDIIISLDSDWSGCWLATGAKDNVARLWRIDSSTNTFTCHGSYAGHAESVGAIALARMTLDVNSPQYQNPLDHPPPFLITGSQDKTIKRWDISAIDPKTRKSVKASYTRKAHEKDINAIDVDHASRLFASASQDKTVKIWSVEDGEVIGLLRGHKRGVWSVRFAPPGTPAITSTDGGNQSSASRGLILTGSGDKTVKIWSLSDYSCLRTFEGHTNSILKVLWLPMPKKDKNAEQNLASRPTEVASAGSDGLVKIWDAQGGECSCTLDNHTDRVWALASNADTGSLVSGGGDSVITFWEDTTEVTAVTASKVATERVEQDQALQNYIRAGSYRKAIVLALQLNHPARLLGLFKEVCAKWPRDKGSLMGVMEVDEVLRSLADEQLVALLRRVRDWNTNARTAPIAQRILWTLVKSYPPTTFVRLGEIKKLDKQEAGMKDVLNALQAYTERHYKRMEDLIDDSYLVDYLLREMDETTAIVAR